MYACGSLCDVYVYLCVCAFVCVCIISPKKKKQSAPSECRQLHPSLIFREQRSAGLHPGSFTSLDRQQWRKWVPGETSVPEVLFMCGSDTRHGEAAYPMKSFLRLCLSSSEDLSRGAKTNHTMLQPDHIKKSTEPHTRPAFSELLQHRFSSEG